MASKFATHFALLSLLITSTQSKEVEHPDKSKHITSFPLDDVHTWHVPCSKQYESDEVKLPGCTPPVGGKCDRVLMDNFINEEEVATLIRIAEKVT
jgi:hypothetical protein